MSSDRPTDPSQSSNERKGENNQGKPSFDRGQASSSIETKLLPSLRYSRSPSQDTNDKIMIDYMSKDFGSFYKAITEFISRRNPNWTDNSPSDFGIALLELFSYAADELSYYQDRISNERNLRTARERSSVARHLSLIGYNLDNGRSANVLLKVVARRTDRANLSISKEYSGIVHKGLQVRPFSSKSKSEIVFEVAEDHFIDAAYNSMKIQFPKDRSGELGPEHTSLALEGVKTKLREGDYLLIEQGEKKDLVRLSEPPHIAYGNTTVTWSKFEPLENRYVKGAIVCGNILKANHGKTIQREILQNGHPLSGGQLQFRLRERPLSFITEFTLPERARTTLRLWVNGRLWREVKNLVEYGPGNEVYEVSIDHNDQTTVIFGNGEHGEKLAGSSFIIAEYRVGQGTIGNVGADVLTEYDLENPESRMIESMINPFPAFGGRDMESAEYAKIVGPRSVGFQERAVTLQDYENLVKQEFFSFVANAKARSIFTGSWNTIFVAVDLRDSARGSEIQLLDGIKKYLEGVKMIGTSVTVTLAKYVPLYIGIIIYFDKSLDAVQVQRLAEIELGMIPDPRGTKGFFHPDNFTFGDQVYASKIYHILRKIPGIKDVKIYRFRRFGAKDSRMLGHASDLSKFRYGPTSTIINNERLKPDSSTVRNLDRGYISIDDEEIIQIENNPVHRDKGTLDLELIGV